MKKIFNRLVLSHQELNEVGRDSYSRGLADGMRLAAFGLQSVLFRLKKLDTWDNDLKNECIEMLEIINSTKK